VDLYKDFTPEEIRMLVRPKRGWGKGSWRDGISNEEYKEICERCSEGKRKGWKRIKASSERYLELLDINREAQKRYWRNLSEGEKREACSKFSERIEKWRDSLSEEQLKLHYKKVSDRMKEYWDSLSSETKEYFLRNSFLKGSGQKTESESYLEYWLNRNKPGEYKYVGSSREVCIGGKFPDFINVNGKKEVIELFGFYWHSEEEVEKKIEHYKKYGFNCKVIWDYECNPVDIPRIIGGN